MAGLFQKAPYHLPYLEEELTELIQSQIDGDDC